MNNINTLNIPMNDNILNAGISVRDHALQKHNKVFVQRMDVRFPLELQQKAIIKFNKRFIEKERNAGYDPILHPVKRRAILRESVKGGDR